MTQLQRLFLAFGCEEPSWVKSAKEKAGSTHEKIIATFRDQNL
jgi:hypothetical protein